LWSLEGAISALGVGEDGILPVETLIVPGSRKLKLTVSLGEVCASFFLLIQLQKVDDLWLTGHQREWGDCAHLGQDACV
jgi:hypothetical protein